jgi:predicted O-methyltransferase YrrM
VTTPEAVNVWQLLRDPRTPRTTWSISEALAVELTSYLECRRPRRILEIGSGLSTVVLGAYAVRHGAEVVTLEHAWRFYQRTQQALTQFGMDGQVRLKLAPLSSRKLAGYGRRARWYDVKLDGQFDFVFVDGPPKNEGRNAVLFAIADHLSPGWELWLDDARRYHERRCLRRWQEAFPRGFFRVQRRDVEGKGLVVLSDARGHHSRPSRPRHLGRGLGIALMVNGDPSWPRRIERCLGPDLLSGSLVVATAQPGGTADSRPTFVDHMVTGETEALHLLSDRPELRYILRLADHWDHRTLDESWLPRAVEILDQREDVELVYLEHRSDTEQHRTADEVERGFAELGTAPFPDGPGLFRPAAVRKLATAGPERGRRRPFRRPPEPPSGVAVQLFPGVFRRMGRY